jgi:uncharacterized protein (TIGR03437 family)
MKAIIRSCVLALSLRTMAQAATASTTLEMNVTGTLPVDPVSAGAQSGTLPLPVTLHPGESTYGTGSATTTSGTGSYSGATGSFPSLTTSSAAAARGGFAVTFSGAGAIATGDSTALATARPTITAVQDAGSYTANIAEGSIFVVKGTNLSASGFSQFSFPLPTSSGGVQIAFARTSGGAVTSAYLVYLYNQSGVNQLAAILPSTLATGAYNVTVTNNNALVSAPFAVTVVQRKPGLITQDSSGAGLAVIQNYISATELDVDRFTTDTVGGVTISPAKPGQALIAWATGLGPVTGGDNIASAGFNFEANGVSVQAVVGGMSITPVYAGRAPGLAGADQINFTLPSNIPTGCTVPFQLSVNGVLSSPTFLSIASGPSVSACTERGLTTSQLQNLDQGGTLTQGTFNLAQFSVTTTVSGVGTVTEKSDSAGGSFTQFTGFQLASAVALSNPSGACQILPQGAASQSDLVLSGVTNLDAGGITLTGPSGSSLANQALAEGSSDNYNLTLGIESPGIALPPGVTFPGLTNATIVPGTYSLKGAGGKDVGPFSASINLGSALTITGGLPASVIRSAGFTLSWTGGNSTDVVDIIGSSGPSGNPTSYLCTTTAGAGTFTVPAFILQQLPAVTAGAVASGTATSSLSVISGPNPANGDGLFSAPLTAGGMIDGGTFFALLGIANAPSYQ